MYLEFFKLKRHPFRITPDPSLFYAGGAHGRGVVLDALVYGISSGEGILKVVGEVGSGKTMLCRMLEERLPKNVEIVYLANPKLSARDIVYAIAFELKLDVDAATDRLVVMQKLQEYLLDRHSEGATVVVFIEEAQSMPLETLEEVRLLSNLETHRHKLMQIVLFGQPELDKKLAEKSIRQLKERITHSFYLDPLKVDEIREYLHFRLQTAGCPWPQLFHPRAEKLISKASGGLTRRINILADKALLAAYADPATRPELRNSAGEILPMILPGHVKTAIQDSDYRNRISAGSELWKYGVVLLAGIMLSAGVFWLWQGLGRTEAQVLQNAGALRQTGLSLSGSEPAAEPSTIQSSGSGVVAEIRTESADSAVIMKIGPAPAEMSTELNAGTSLIDHNEEEGGSWPGSAVSVSEQADIGLQSSETERVESELPADSTQPGSVTAKDPEIHSVSSVDAVKPDSSSDPVEANTATPDIAQPLNVTSVPSGEASSASGVIKAAENAAVEPDALVLSRAETTGPGPLSGLVAGRILRSRAWLAALAGKQGFSVQMFAVPRDQSMLLEDFLQELANNGLLEQTYLCLISGNANRPEQWLVFQNEFAILGETRTFIRSLPESLRQYGPYPRNLDDIACLGE